jgi:hypothetical protein
MLSEMAARSSTACGTSRSRGRVNEWRPSTDLPRSRRGLAVLSALLALSYWEPVEFAGLKVAVLWKWIAILLIAAPALLALSRRGLGVLRSWTGVFLAGMVVAAVFAATVDPEPSASLRVAAQRLFIFAVLVHADYPSRSTTSLSCVYWVPPALVVAAAPFYLGILRPLGATFRYSEVYGFATPGFVGVFQNAHAASLAMGLGIIVAFWRVMVERSPARLLVNVLLLAALAVLAVQT